MLNYNNSTEYLKIFNRKGLTLINKLVLSIDGKKYIDCSVISLTPRYIYFNSKQLGILQSGRFEYTLLADDVEIDRGIINVDFSSKSLIQTDNKIINYGTKQ